MINSLPNNSNPESSNNLPSFRARRSGSPPDGPRPNIDVPGSVKRHWVASLLVLLVLFCGGAFVLWKKAKPTFESSSVVYISPTFPKMLAGDTEVELPYDSYVQNQIQTVTRYDIIADALSKMPYSVRQQSGPVLPYEIQLLQRNLEIKRIGDSYEMSIGLSGPTPNGLADVVNAVTDSYVEKAKNEEFYGLNDRLKTLNEEKDRLQKEMDDRLGEQAQLMEQLGVATISSTAGATNPFDSTLDAIRTQLATAQMQRQAAEAELDSVVKGSTTGATSALDAAADEAVAADPGLSGIRSSLNSRRAALTQEMNGLRPDHPIYQKDKEELSSIDAQMADLRRKAADGLEERLRENVSRTRMIELQLTQELGDKTHTATSAAPKFQRAAELGPEIESVQKAYDAINDRIRDLELESSSPGSIHVSTKALTPIGPEQSKIRLYFLALIFSSLICAVAAPVGIDLMDNRIYTSQDIERVIGFHPLGVLLNDDEFSQEISSEYYVRLAAGIDHAVRNSGARTFLFTAPAHGCGTSTVVRKVSDKLRGFNLRTRTITALGFGELEVAGSSVAPRSELLLQKLIKSDELQHSPLTPFTVGTDNPRYRLDQESPAPNPVVRTLHHASVQYDVVLIDASPIPISANTEYLARVADATVLVVESSVTTKQELDRAARLLERLEVAGVAVILNKVNLSRADRALKKEFRRYEQSLQNRRSEAEMRIPRRGKASA